MYNLGQESWHVENFGSVLIQSGLVIYHMVSYNRDLFVYTPSQWEMTLYCNVVSHWLGAYTKDACIKWYCIQNSNCKVKNKWYFELEINTPYFTLMSDLWVCLMWGFLGKLTITMRQGHEWLRPWVDTSINGSKLTLGPNDAIWRQRSRSTLVLVMAYCLMAPSHYLNQCWPIISKVLWHSSEDIIIRRFEDTNQ